MCFTVFDSFLDGQTYSEVFAPFEINLSLTFCPISPTLKYSSYMFLTTSSFIFICTYESMPNKNFMYKYIFTCTYLFAYRVCLEWVYFCWNWKHCNQIIFKCVNSIVELIFNKKVVKKCNLWDRKQYIYALFTVDKVNNYGLEKKKKKKEENVEKKNRRGFQLKANGHIICVLCYLYSIPIFTWFSSFCLFFL